MVSHHFAEFNFQIYLIAIEVVMIVVRVLVVIVLARTVVKTVVALSRYTHYARHDIIF